MNDALIKQLVPAVRDRFHSIPDNLFDDVPEVIKLREELAFAKNAHCEAVKAHDKVREVIADSAKGADIARQMLADLEAGRGYALAVAFVNGDVDFADDERTQDELHALRTTIERVTLARPGLERILMDRYGDMEAAADPVREATRKLSDGIDELKLDLARNQSR